MTFNARAPVRGSRLGFREAVKNVVATRRPIVEVERESLRACP
jgi:hypothetical protein